MGQLLIRNLNDAVIERYKALAELNQRSLEAEVRAALEGGLTDRKVDLAELSRKIRKRTANKPGSIESWKLINEGRDER